MWSRGLWMVAAIAFAIAFVSLARTAQAAEGPAVPVEIIGNDTVRSIELAGPAGPVKCRNQCSLEVQPGRYRLVVTDAEQHRFSEWLEVGGPSRVNVAPGNQDARVAGKVLFGVGLAGIAAGSLMLGGGLYGQATRGLGPDGCQGDCDAWRPWAIAGGITLAAGVAAGATGLFMWRRNGRATISETSSETPSAAAPSRVARLQLAPAAGPRWTGLALAGTF